MEREIDTETVPSGAETVELHALRRRIDELDERLVATLADRFRAAEAVGSVKSRTGVLPTDPRREAEVLRRASGAARDSGVPEEGVRDVFWAVLGYCRQAVIEAHGHQGAAGGPNDGPAGGTVGSAAEHADPVEAS